MRTQERQNVLHIFFEFQNVFKWFDCWRARADTFVHACMIDSDWEHWQCSTMVLHVACVAHCLWVRSSLYTEATTSSYSMQTNENETVSMTLSLSPVKFILWLSFFLLSTEIIILFFNKNLFEKFRLTYSVTAKVWIGQQNTSRSLKWALRCFYFLSVWRDVETDAIIYSK